MPFKKLRSNDIFRNSLKMVQYLRAPLIHRTYRYPGLDPKSKSATRISKYSVSNTWKIKLLL